MPIELTPDERARLQRFVRRPRSRKQLYRAEAILALDGGMPVEAVARKFRVGMERVEGWIERFEKDRLKFLAEPKGGPPRAREGRPEPGIGEMDE